MPHIDWDDGAIERTKQMRAIQRNARQWVFRAFAPDGRTVHTAESEIRGPSGEIAALRVSRDQAADPVQATRAERARPVSPDPHVRTDAEIEAELVRAIAGERAYQDANPVSAY
jgi:hypothetical protein